MNNYKKIELYQEAVKFELLEDYREAFNLYLASAKQGYAKSQLAVAKYYLGTGDYKGIIKYDRKKAVEFLNQAEAGGNAEAKYILAKIMLEQKYSGDIKRAVELLQDASDRKYSPASYELAKCYYYGVGCGQDYTKAIALLGRIMYAYVEPVQLEHYNGMRKILTELKGLVLEHREEILLSENDLCLFNDLCNDLDIN